MLPKQSFRRFFLGEVRVCTGMRRPEVRSSAPMCPLAVRRAVISANEVKLSLFPAGPQGEPPPLPHSPPAPLVPPALTQPLPPPRQLLAHFHCVSCDRPLRMVVPGP